ncbi:MAG: prohibitin family protein, partial [Chloroflexota bacterium]
MNVTIVLDMLSGAMWLLFIGLIALAVVRASRARPTKGILTVMAAAGAGAAILSSLSAGLVFIPPEERGVVISAVAEKGYREEALQPGLNWVIPFFETVRTYSISKQTYTMTIASNEGAVQGDDSVTARTADGQEIYIDASVIYAIDPAKVIQTHITWQDRYTDNLVRPLARGIVRGVISQYGVEDVITAKRDEIADKITETMRQKLDENGLLLSDFVLRNITFSEEYAASVEQKQIAEQQAQQARFVVEQRRQEAEQARQQAQGLADAVVIQAKGDAQARLVQAEAESKALEMLSTVLKDNPGLTQYLFVNRLAPGVQTIFLPNNGNYLLPLPTQGGASSSTGIPALPDGTLFPTLPAPPVPPAPTPTPTP